MAAAPYLKPLPQITEGNKPFWDGLRERIFLVPRCDDCGDYNWPPYPACRSCFSESLTWTRIDGGGEIYTYTVVHRGPGVFQEEVPYVVALVKLHEHPRPVLVMGNVVGIPPDQVRIGQAVRIEFDDIPGEDVTMWHFSVTDGAEAAYE